MNPEYDYLVKTYLVGDSDVGKSCLLLRWADDIYTESNISKINVEFKIRTDVIDEKVIKQQVWDNHYHNNRKLFLELANPWCERPKCIVFVFDLTNQESFNSVIQTMEDAREIIGSPNVNMILVGNKCDLQSKRVVDKEEATKLASKFGMSYLEASAKDSTNVDTVFRKVAGDVIQKFIMRGNNQISYRNPLTRDIVKYNKTKAALISCLEIYMSATEKRNPIKGQINFRSFLFPFFKNSRAINREANYYLAAELLKQLKEQTSVIGNIFNETNIKTTREQVIQNRKLFLRNDYVNRGMNSKFINNVIEIAQSYVKSCSTENTQCDRTPLLRNC